MWSPVLFCVKFERKEFFNYETQNGQKLLWRRRKLLGKGGKSNANTGGTTSAKTMGRYWLKDIQIPSQNKYTFTFDGAEDVPSS